MPKTSNSAMAFEPAIAVYDACILYPSHLRNIVVQAAVDRLIEARWTDEIHDEWMRNLAADTPALSLERPRITRQLMNDALPSAMVGGYAGLIPTVHFPDPHDRHVVAAGIAAGASVILTWNLRDFPIAVLKAHKLLARTPDAFLAELHDKAPDLMVASLENTRRNLSRTRLSASDFTEILRRQKLTRLAARIQEHSSGPRRQSHGV
jgi:hypothetical protein